MKYKFSVRSLKALEGLHPDIVRFAHELLRMTPIDFVILEGLRTVERQRELVARGASKTMNSRHITGHAIDCGVWLGTIRWEMPLYYELAAAAREASRNTGVPIRWGGAWARLDLTTESPEELVNRYADECRAANRRPLFDGPHLELPAQVYP